MEHVDSELQLGAEQIKFNDLIRRGDDFMKIEIYRNARKYYTEALGTHINDILVNEKIAGCDGLIRKESGIIISIVIAAAVIAGVVCIIMLA
ncbi:MAG: hypothetical protein NTW49_14235 [Bacteroidia bacterium]|nr:hypothetical protein [Bacteroidia bacterium]